MPGQMIYFSDENYIQLRKMKNRSEFINNLLNDHFDKEKIKDRETKIELEKARFDENYRILQENLKNEKEKLEQDKVLKISQENMDEIFKREIA